MLLLPMSYHYPRSLAVDLLAKAWSSCSCFSAWSPPVPNLYIFHWSVLQAFDTIDPVLWQQSFRIYGNVLKLWLSICLHCSDCSLNIPGLLLNKVARCCQLSSCSSMDHSVDCKTCLRSWVNTGEAYLCWAPCCRGYIAGSTPSS